MAPPTPLPSAGETSRGQDWAVTYGRKMAAGVRRLERQMEGWKGEGREWLKLLQRFIREVQEPGSRSRHMLTLLGLAAAIGLAVGFATGRRREG